MEKDVLVMIPGPTTVVGSIREQMSREMQAFGDPRFVSDYKELIEKLGSLFNCGGKTFPLAGTGTIGLEMAIANTVRRGDNILIVTNGYFGDRFIEICEKKELNIDVLTAESGLSPTAADIDKKLSEKKYAAVTVTHVDTSTGILAPIEEIGGVLKKYPETIYIVDGVAATGGEFADIDGMGIDIMITGSQKAFGVSPGMFVVWAGKNALKRREALGKIPEYYMDFEKWLPIMENPAKYFATPAVNLVWAMKEATEIIEEEGLKNRFERHKKNACALRRAFDALGLKTLAKPGFQANTLSVLLYPEGVDDISFRKALYEEGVIVAPALGEYAGKAFRIGHMGNISVNDMLKTLYAIERSLASCGVSVATGASVSAFMECMSE